MSDRGTPTTHSGGWFRRLLPRPGIGRGGQGIPDSPMQVQRDERLPSSAEDIAFRVSLEVFWASHGERDDLDEETAAVDGVVERATVLSRLVSPLDADGLERQLSVRLATPSEVGQSGIWAFAHVLGVVVRETDLEEAEKRRTLRRARDRADIEREIEQAEIAYLHEKVFSDLGYAVLWWLRREEYALDSLPDSLPHLDRIVQTVSGAAPERSTAEALVGAIRALFEDHINLQYDVIEIVRRALIELGREEEATELVERGKPYIKALGASVPDGRDELPGVSAAELNGYATPTQPTELTAAEPAESESHADP